VWCALSLLSLIGDEIFHNVFHCAMSVVCPVLGFKGCPCSFTLHFSRGQFVHHAPQVGVGCAGAEALPIFKLSLLEFCLVESLLVPELPLLSQVVIVPSPLVPSKGERSFSKNREFTGPPWNTSSLGIAMSGS